MDSPGTDVTANRSRVGLLILVILLVLHAILAVTSLRRNSVTLDEFAHLPAGVSYWQTGSFALYHHNPPLVKMLAALPVLASGARVDYSGSWEDAQTWRVPPDRHDFGAEFMWANADRYFELFFRARLAIVAGSLLGCVLVFLWSRELWGTTGGLISAALWAFSVNILAHAGLVTTDLGVTVAGFGATYAFWRWLRAPSWRRAVIAGAVLGVAQLVKYSALLLYALWPALALGDRTLRRHDEQRPHLAAAGTLMLVICLLVINVGYWFEGSGRQLGSFPFLSRELTVSRTSGTGPDHPKPTFKELYNRVQNRFASTWLAFIPIPLPWHYVLGFDAQRWETAPGLERIGQPPRGYLVYLRGEFRNTSWMHYFLYALAVKVPLGTWLLLGVAIATGIAHHGFRARPRDELALWLPPVAIVATMSLLIGLNLGLRYVLGAFPYVFVAVGRLGRAALLPGRWRWAVIVALAVGLGSNTLAAIVHWPHYLSFFNRLVGGPRYGHNHLIDSNLDWGQDLLEVKRLIDENPSLGQLGLAYFGNVDPRIAGIDFHLPPRDPRIVPPTEHRPVERSLYQRGFAPGVYAISVNYLIGLGYEVNVPDEGTVVVPPGAFTYFHQIEPHMALGHSIWIFRIDEGAASRLTRILIGEKNGTAVEGSVPQE